MRHAVLGLGGVGGIVAAALARAGAPVVGLVRGEHPDRIHVASAVLGSFEAAVPTARRLESEVDVLWMTVKATQLEAALEAAPAERVAGTVIPLLNGVDHLGALRSRYPSVTAGALGGETERVAPGRIEQTSPFLWVEVARGPFSEQTVADLKAGGVTARVVEDERTLLWQKLLLLAPLALATTAHQVPVGGLRADPATWTELGAAVDEVAAVAAAEGVRVDPELTRRALSGMPEGFRTSMQKDRAAGRPLELDHIAGPIQRGGRRHAIPTPAVDGLVRAIAGPASG